MRDGILAGSGREYWSDKLMTVHSDDQITGDTTCGSHGVDYENNFLRGDAV
jgi:hypothetical protein